MKTKTKSYLVTCTNFVSVTIRSESTHFRCYVVFVSKFMTLFVIVLISIVVVLVFISVDEDITGRRT